MNDFTGYSAIVTGGSMGIGAATTRALCNAGARVTALDIQDGADADGWDRILDANLKVAFDCVRAAVPHLRARGPGAIVNLANRGGELPDTSP